MSKKEAKGIAAKNRSMKDWVSKVITPTKPKMTGTDQYDLEIAPEMKWEDSLDIEKDWRLSVAKEKTDRSRTRFMNKVMIIGVVDEVESTLVVGRVVDSLIEVSSFMGKVNMVWKQLLDDEMLKEAIMKKLEQEERDNTILLEFQIKEERLEKQRRARQAWRDAKSNKDISFLTDSLNRIELEEEDDLNVDFDDEGDYIMSNIDVTKS